jgi:hypothetical protein
LGQRFKTQFDSEAEDKAWADATEAVILERAASFASLTTVTTWTVECRETVCRLQIGFVRTEDVPGGGDLERDKELVASAVLPMLRQAGLRPLVVPYPREIVVPERTYYFVR